MEYKILYTAMVLFSFWLGIGLFHVLSSWKHANDGFLNNLACFLTVLILSNIVFYAIGRLIIWIWSV